MAYGGDTGDPYVDPVTGVLKNLAGIKDATLLEAFDSNVSSSANWPRGMVSRCAGKKCPPPKWSPPPLLHSKATTSR